MADPSLALQAAVVAALKSANVAGGRVYDSVPPGPTFPYVSIGDGQVIGEDTDGCGDGSEIHLQVDAWSRAVGYPEVKSLAADIRAALKAVPTLAGCVVTVVQFQNCQYLRDPDGLTRHAALTFMYLITH